MSTIKLYRSTPTTAGRWKLLASKLFKIENIESFLAEVPSANIITITDFQYIKTQLEISIKIDNNQIDAEVQTPVSFRYVSVRNTTNGRIAYYFVKKATSRSQKCVQLDLVLDVLNTYTDGVDYIFKSNTKITREHKDRYTRTKSMTCTIDYQVTASSGSLTEGDRVVLTNDRGDDVFIGTLIYIDQYYANIQIENPTSEEDYISRIEPYLEDRFDLSKVDAPANYISFEPSTMQDFNFTTTYKYYRNIDPVIEGINPLLQCGNAEGVKIENPKSILNQNWYLLYRNQNDPSESLVNPVECYIIPEEDVQVDSGAVVNGRLMPSFIEENKTYVFDITNTRVGTLSNGVVTSTQTGFLYGLIVTKAGNKLNVSLGRIDVGLQVFRLDWQYDDIDFVTFTGLPIPYSIFNNPVVWNSTLITTPKDYSFDNTSQPSYIDGISKLDRTDSKNIKLIKLPYCPYSFGISNNILETAGSIDWDYVSMQQSNGGSFLCLKLKNMHTKLYAEMSLSSSMVHPFHNLYMILTPNENDLREDELDSKLYHSEFYKPTYYYDSFSFAVALEKCNLTSYIDNNDYNYLKLRFDVTSTINSRFMFTFSNYYIRYGEQNYAKNLIIVRNNEEVLYNVPYINYVRSGINYDVKNKNIQQVASWTGVGLSAVSIGASLLAPSVPLKVAGVVGSLISMAVSVKGAITTSVQAEENLKQKILQAQLQTESVKGSDDVDLMSVYAENRLKYLIYEPMPNMKSLLNDLFFYAGYNSGRMGIPTHNNRINFDYLECDAVLESISSNMSDDIISELVNTYKTGVTFIHQSNRDTDKWDIEQKYENWERSLMED